MEEKIGFVGSSQQQETLSREALHEEYEDVQRAAVESVQIGRATLAQVDQQGEQLNRAEGIADDTQYTLDKAGRVLRGMTWSGWVANVFSKDIQHPSEVGDPDRKQRPRRTPPRVYENIPLACQPAAQAIQNYVVNLDVLEACDSDEQRETCRIVCDQMYKVAAQQVETLKAQAPDKMQAYRLQFEEDLAVLREKQIKNQKQQLPIPQTPTKAVASLDSAETPPRQKVPGNEATKATPIGSPESFESVEVQQQKKAQDDHLNFLAQNLDELGTIAGTLNEAVSQQNQTMSRLDSKSENILEKNKQVTRRADRLVQSKSWAPPKPTYVCQISIRHVDSGKYLSVINDDVFLVPTVKGPSCLFSMWKRQGSLFGLKNKSTGRWVGQNFFGSLACSATSFGRREEWEQDNTSAESVGANPTALLCASAGWGAGGYLVVREKDHAVLIGGSGVEEKKKAALWLLQESDD